MTLKIPYFTLFLGNFGACFCTFGDLISESFRKKSQKHIQNTLPKPRLSENDQSSSPIMASVIVHRK